jgi:hypothetical protein
MAHAGNSLRSTLVTLFIFAIILSPMATSDAARLTQRGKKKKKKTITIINSAACIRQDLKFYFQFVLQLQDPFALLVYVAHLPHWALAASVALLLLLSPSLRMGLHEPSYSNFQNLSSIIV